MGFPGHGLVVIFKSSQISNTQLLPNKRYNAVGSIRKILKKSAKKSRRAQLHRESQTVVISAVLLNNRPIGIIEVKVARQLISCRFAVEATVGAALLDREKLKVEDITDLWVSEAVCSRLLRAWCGMVRAVALQFQSHHEQTNKRHTNLWDRRSKSARTPLLTTGRTGEESAADGLADYLEERSQACLPAPKRDTRFSAHELSM